MPFTSLAGCTANCSAYSDGCIHYSFGWICNCWAKWAWDDYCYSPIYQFIPPPLYNLMWIGGLVFIVPGTLIILVEIVMQLRSGVSLNSTASYTKLSCLFFGILRCYYFIEVGVLVNLHQGPLTSSHLIASEFFFWIPIFLGVICLCLCTLAWLNLVLSLESLSPFTSKQFKITKNVFSIATGIFIAGGFVLSVLVSTRSPTVYGLLVLWFGLMGFPTSIYCIFNVVRLHGTVDALDRNTRQKNFVLGSISVVMLVTLITFIIMRLCVELILIQWIYMTFMVILRFEEVLLFYLFIFFCLSQLPKQFNTSTQSEKNFSS
eukprot:TRINITY_DN6610_c0_g2_i2.p1 TRINITY_DN6610_c0_g2~~TRINITY_DN6610_c0_g2_i2.p1  ORF type:complete len:319 (-),score=25.11 TRINITY_DN6610_c0_g2_i2:6-962(-)